MAIKKQEFYEGAALHHLACNGGMKNIQYIPPFFLLNENIFVYFKYSTKKRSPWGFTFTKDEQTILNEASNRRVTIGLICGDDGIAAIRFEMYRRIAAQRRSSVHISCFRNHREHYQVNGPDGTLEGKVAPSNWSKILES